MTGLSRGFGYVSFEEKEAADAAISSLTGSEVEGRLLKLDIAAPRQERAPRDTNRAPRDDSVIRATNPKHSVYVGNLNFASTEVDLKAFAEANLGGLTPLNVRVSIDRETGKANVTNFLLIFFM